MFQPSNHPSHYYEQEEEQEEVAEVAHRNRLATKQLDIGVYDYQRRVKGCAPRVKNS